MKRRPDLHREQAIRMTPIAAMGIVSKVIENRGTAEEIFPVNDLARQIVHALGFKFKDGV